MTIHEKYTAAVAEYLRRIQFNGLSEQTLKNYESTLRRFGEYLAKQENTDDLYAVVEQWRDDLLCAGAAKSTVKAYLTNLKIFFSKASKRSFPAEMRFAENPVDEDFMPKVTKKPYDNLLDDSDIIRLWENKPKNGSQVRYWERNYAIICLILGTGLRNKEVLDLRLSDVDWRDETVTVRSGKGDKYRIVDAPRIVLESITAYLNSGIRPAYLSDDDYLFGTQAQHAFGVGSAEQTAEKWHRGTKEWLSTLIERHVDSVCGGENHIRSHSLRHIYARLHLNVNGNISELQSALGHSSPEISQIYAGRIAPRRARDSARAVIAARDAAAEQLRRMNQKEQNVIPFIA